METGARRLVLGFMPNINMPHADKLNVATHLTGDGEEKGYRREARRGEPQIERRASPHPGMEAGWRA